MGDVRAIREPVSMAVVVQHLADAPAFGKVIISFEHGQPVHMEIRNSVKLRGGTTPEVAQ